MTSQYITFHRNISNNLELISYVKAFDLAKISPTGREMKFQNIGVGYVPYKGTRFLILNKSVIDVFSKIYSEGSDVD